MRVTCISALFAWLLAAGLAGRAPAGEPPGPDGIAVTLEGGAAHSHLAQDPAARTDLVLDFTARGAAWDKEVWGCAMWFNSGQHRGEITRFDQRADRVRLAVAMTIADDPRVPGGAAAYEIDLQRQGDALTGTYTGTFLETAVAGRATGRIAAPAVREVPGHVPLAEGEHPRLIFRARDLEELKRRMQTPEGEAIVAMLARRSPLRDARQVTDRHASWMAANWGVMHHLLGDRDAPEKARRILMDEVVKRPMPLDRADIHHGPRLLGVALAYDLCYDAWDAPFRALVTEYLRAAMRDLARGTSDGIQVADLNPAPWSHASAIRMSAVGCAAIALLGEKDAAGAPIAEAPLLVRAAERSVVLYLRRGLAASGAGMEGDFYKSLALANGVLQFLHALRVAAGRDAGGANPFLLAGHVLESAEKAEGGRDFGISSLSVQASGRWPMGLGSVPAEFLPAMKWCFDRDAGLAGKGHFDCTYPYHAAYALANYPFGVAARPPGEVLPLFVPDPAQGRHVFRSAWQDAGDFVTVLHLRTGALRGMEEKALGRAFEVHVSGLGREWIGAPVGLAERNAFLGAETVLYESPRPRQAVLTAGMDAVYLQDLTAPVKGRPPRKASPAAPTAAEAADAPDGLRLPRAPGVYKDLNIRCTRHFAVDYSGASGAPALFVLIDRLQNAAAEPWDLGLGRGARFSGNRFTLSDLSGARLTGLVAAPAAVRGARLSGSNEYFVVFVIQAAGAPDPPMKVEGDGLAAKVSVGGQTVSFDPAGPGKIVFAK